jgi:hypothetical protein
MGILIVVFCSYAAPQCRHEIPMPSYQACVEEARIARRQGAHEAYCISERRR